MYNQYMTFFKSVLDATDVDLQAGQILVKNTSGRPFRVSTVGVLTPTGGYAVVDESDPVVAHNLRNKRIVEVRASKLVSQPAEEAKLTSKKSKKKKSEVQSEELVSDESSEEVAEEVTEEVIIEPVATEEESAPVETAETVEELKVTPDMANDSL